MDMSALRTDQMGGGVEGSWSRFSVCGRAWRLREGAQAGYTAQRGKFMLCVSLSSSISPGRGRRCPAHQTTACTVPHFFVVAFMLSVGSWVKVAPLCSCKPDGNSTRDSSPQNGVGLNLSSVGWLSLLICFCSVACWWRQVVDRLLGARRGLLVVGGLTGPEERADARHLALTLGWPVSSEYCTAAPYWCFVFSRVCVCVGGCW